MATPHSGEYQRKIIVNKVPDAFASRATEIVHENGRYYVIKLTLPTEWQQFLDAYNTEEINQSGQGFVYRKSPWAYADPTENNKRYYGKRGHIK